MNHTLAITIWFAVLALLTLTALGPCITSAQARPHLIRTVQMQVTAYCPCSICCGRHSDGKTASGTKADHPLVAAPRSIPFGSWVIVPGYNHGNPVRVEDRGRVIRGNRLDVLFQKLPGEKGYRPAHARAVAWGVQTLSVTIQYPNKEDRS